MNNKLFKYIIIIGFSILCLTSCVPTKYFVRDPQILVASKKLPVIKDNSEISIR